MTVFDQTKDFVLNLVNKSAHSKHTKSGGAANTFKVIIGLTVAQGFFIGMFGKFVAATLCYPLTRIKVMCQAQTKKAKKGSISGNDELERTLSPIEMAKKVFRTDGIGGFFYGVEGQVFNAALKQGLNFMVKERIQLLLLAIWMPAKLKEMKMRALKNLN
jgi:hypothetical protein